MFNLQQIICYSVLLLLLACEDNNRRRVASPPPNGTLRVIGTPAGVAVMSSNRISYDVSHMQMNIFGTQGKSADKYNGPARFQGTITFSRTCTSGSAYPHQPYSQYPGQQCPPMGASVPFNCQGRIYNEGNFDCQINLYGSSHTIRGALGPKQTTNQDYEILGVRVDGRCIPPCPP